MSAQGVKSSEEARGATPVDSTPKLIPKAKAQGNECVLHSTSAALFSAKLVLPLKEVGPNDVPLTGAPCYYDSISFPGCKTYSQISYNCLSRVYVTAIAPAPPTAKESLPALNVVRNRYTNKGPATLESMEKQYLSDGFYVWDSTDKKLVLKSSILEPIPSDNTTTDAPTDESAPVLKDTSYAKVPMIPVSMVSVNHMPQRRLLEQIPYSANFLSMREKLSASQQQGALNSIVKAPTFRDVTSTMSLAKWLNTAGELPCEQAALLRLICMGMSIDMDLYRCDPTPLQFIRRGDLTAKQKIWVTPFGVDKVFTICLAPIDTTVAIALNSNKVTPGWKHSNLDKTWTMVPMTADFMDSDSAIPYVAAFMHSKLWSGAVNIETRMTWRSPDWLQYREGPVATMPKINSVFIPGPTKVMIVLTDFTSANLPDSIYFGGAQIPPFGKPHGDGYDFALHIWSDWYTERNMDKCRTAISDALSRMMKSMCTGTVVGSTLAMASELYGRWGFGIYTRQQAKRDYLSQQFSGAWAWQKSDKLVNSIDKKNGKILAGAYAATESDGKHNLPVDDFLRDGMMEAFNFAGHSPCHILPSGGIPANPFYKLKTVKIDDKDTNIIENLRNMWLFDRDPSGTFAYNVDTCSSVNLS